ncbi:M56 family metallopeptidase [Solilutibacter tolerans]|uniref:Signal transducer regulating beta-lactamase production, contains metallopeptidase domain n=1 Tax=Solilutibacter tolerans TaxID=1604334 RepID=A0A1N6UCU5_9GAMM|nr:M56 family metallopeptidase [Lysobacter tolerans]SIQ63410.1 Signal transducer regulating beta-lactamase production, contains metallopeptidase domain [Lysobacter tolerans]
MIAGNAVLESLWLATWTGSIAIIIVMLLRAPVRRRFGAGIAYALWWLPVATWLALWLPARVIEVPVQAGSPALDPVAVTTVAGTSDPSFDMNTLWMPMWLLGVGLMIGMLLWQQRRFERALGRMRALDGERSAWQAESAAGLPAVVGLLRPRIILPADIDTRFDDKQRGLMLAHERIHLHRGDAWANAFTALVRCVFWFNPLVHIASSRMRHDQELACDARVIAAYPHARRAYGEAMLKNANPSLMVPLGCHWGITHPMKERVMLLKNAIPSRGTRMTGALLVGVAAIAVAAAAWAAMPPRQMQRSSEVIVKSEGRDFQASFDIAMDGGPSEDVLVVGRYGEPFTVRIADSETGSFELEGTVTQASANGAPAYRIEARLQRDGKSVGNPVMVVGAGKQARIKLGDEAANGKFAGVDVNVQIGDVDPAALQARDQAEMARHQVERTRVMTHQAHASAAAEAEKAAAEARLAADEAARAADEASGMSAVEARAAAEAAREAANEAAEAASEAAADAAQAAAEAAVMADEARIERRVIRKTYPAPPAPPQPPTAAMAPRAPAAPPPPRAPGVPAMPRAPKAPPAPATHPAPPAPWVASGKASLHIEREVRNGAAPSTVAKAVTVASHAQAVAAGGRVLTSDQAASLGLEPGYRWVDMQSLISGHASASLRIESAIVTTDKDGETPRYIGYIR